MNATSKFRTLIVGMGGISRQMHGVLKTKPWVQCAGVVDVSAAVDSVTTRQPVEVTTNPKYASAFERRQS